MKFENYTYNKTKDEDDKNKKFKYDKSRASKLYNDISVDNVKFDNLTFKDQKTVLQFSVDQGLDDYNDYKTDVIKDYGIKKPSTRTNTTFTDEGKVDYETESVESEDNSGAFFGNEVSYNNTPEENARLQSGDKLRDDLFNSAIEGKTNQGKFYDSNDSPASKLNLDSLSSKELFNKGIYSEGVKKEQEEIKNKNQSLVKTPYGEKTYEEFMKEVEEKNDVATKFNQKRLMKKPVELKKSQVNSENSNEPAPEPFDYMTKKDYANTYKGLDIAFKPIIPAQIQVLDSSGKLDKEATKKARERFENGDSVKKTVGGRHMHYNKDGSIDTERMKESYKTEMNYKKNESPVDVDELLDKSRDDFINEDNSFSFGALKEDVIRKRIYNKRSEILGQMAVKGSNDELKKDLAKIDLFIENNPEMQDSEKTKEFRKEHKILGFLDKGISGVTEQITLWTNNLGEKAMFTGLGALTGNPQAGYIAGSSKDMFMIETGNAYEEARKAGVPHEIARKEAMKAGVINAGIESGQMALFLATSGLSKIGLSGASKVGAGTVDKLFGKFASKVASKTGSQLAGKVTEIGTRWGAGAVGEMTQEGLQAVMSKKYVNDSVNLAVERGFLSKNELREYDFDDYSKVFSDEFKAVAPTMIMLGGIGVGTGQVVEATKNHFEKQDKRARQLYVAKSMDELKFQSKKIAENPEHFVTGDKKQKIMNDVNNYIEFAKKYKEDFSEVAESDLGFDADFDEVLDLLNNYKKYLNDLEQNTKDTLTNSIDFELEEGTIEKAKEEYSKLEKVYKNIGMSEEDLIEVRNKIENKEIENEKFVNNMDSKNLGKIKTQRNKNNLNIDELEKEIISIDEKIENTESKKQIEELEEQKSLKVSEMENLINDNAIITQEIENRIESNETGNTEEQESYQSLYEKTNENIENKNIRIEQNEIEQNEIEQNKIEPLSAEELKNKTIPSDRDFESLGSRKIKSMQNEFEELKPFIQEQARITQGEFQAGVKGKRYPILMEDSTNKAEIIGYDGNPRIASKTVDRILNNTNATYAKINDAFNNIIEGNDRANLATAKRIEVILNDILTEGYETFEGIEIPPNEEYIQTKRSLGLSENDFEIGETEVESQNVDQSQTKLESSEVTNENNQTENVQTDGKQSEFEQESEVSQPESVQMEEVEKAVESKSQAKPKRDEQKRADIGKRFYQKMNTPVNLGNKISEIRNRLMEKGVSEQEIDFILDNYFEVMQQLQDAGMEVNFDLEIVESISDLIDQDILKEHGLEEANNIMIDGATLVDSDIHKNSIKTSMEIVSLPKKPITETFIHELSEMYAEIWRQNASESFESISQELIDNDLATEDNVQEFIADFLTDNALEKKMDLNDENSAIDSVVGEYVAKFKNWASNIIKRLSNLRNTKERVPDLLNKQAEMFSNGNWKEAIEMYQSAEKTYENSYSDVLQQEMVNDLVSGSLNQTKMVNKYGIGENQAQILLEKMNQLGNEEEIVSIFDKEKPNLSDVKEKTLEPNQITNEQAKVLKRSLKRAEEKGYSFNGIAKNNKGTVYYSKTLNDSANSLANGKTLVTMIGKSGKVASDVSKEVFDSLEKLDTVMDEDANTIYDSSDFEDSNNKSIEQSDEAVSDYEIEEYKGKPVPKAIENINYKFKKAEDYTKSEYQEMFNVPDKKIDKMFEIFQIVEQEMYSLTEDVRSQEKYQKELSDGTKENMKDYELEEKSSVDIPYADNLLEEKNIELNDAKNEIRATRFNEVAKDIIDTMVEYEQKEPIEVADEVVEESNKVEINRKEKYKLDGKIKKQYSTEKIDGKRVRSYIINATTQEDIDRIADYFGNEKKYEVLTEGMDTEGDYENSFVEVFIYDDENTVTQARDLFNRDYRKLKQNDFEEVENAKTESTNDKNDKLETYENHIIPEPILGAGVFDNKDYHEYTIDEYAEKFNIPEDKKEEVYKIYKKTERKINSDLYEKVYNKDKYYKKSNGKRVSLTDKELREMKPIDVKHATSLFNEREIEINNVKENARKNEWNKIAKEVIDTTIDTEKNRAELEKAFDYDIKDADLSDEAFKKRYGITKKEALDGEYYNGDGSLEEKYLTEGVNSHIKNPLKFKKNMEAVYNKMTAKKKLADNHLVVKAKISHLDESLIVGTIRKKSGVILTTEEEFDRSTETNIQNRSIKDAVNHNVMRMKSNFKDKYMKDLKALDSSIEFNTGGGLTEHNVANLNFEYNNDMSEGTITLNLDEKLKESISEKEQQEMIEEEISKLEKQLNKENLEYELQPSEESFKRTIKFEIKEDVNKYNEEMKKKIDDFFSGKMTEDTRFSVSESFEKRKFDIDEQGNLLFVHGIYKDKLKKALDLGALPMPSLAMIDDKTSYTGFGEISLIGSKEFFNPNRASNNLFDSDVYSPRFPRTKRFLYQEKAREWLNDFISEYKKFDVEEIEDSRARNYSDPESLAHALYRSPAIKIKYASEVLGEEYDYLTDKKVIETTKYISKLFNKNLKDDFIQFLKNETIIDEKYIDLIKEKGIRKATKELSSEITADGAINSKKKMFEYFKENVDSEITFEDFKEEVGFYKSESKDAFSLIFKDNLSEINEEFSNHYIDKQIFPSGEYSLTKKYKKWLSNKIKSAGLFSEPYFTEWNPDQMEEIKYKVTPENALKLMKKKSLQAGEGNLVSGFNEFKSAFAKKLTSFKEARKRAETNLADFEEKKYKEYTDSLNSKILEFVKDYDLSTGGSSFVDADAFIDTVIEYKESTLHEMRKYSEKLDANFEEASKRFNELITLAQTLPVNYFELKPNRIVGFDEFNYAVVPNKLDANLKEKLSDLGYNLIQYDGTPKGYRKALAETKGDPKVRFSVENIDESETLTDESLKVIEEIKGSEKVNDYKRSAKKIKQNADIIRKNFDPVDSSESFRIEELLNKIDYHINFTLNETNNYIDFMEDGFDALEKHFKELKEYGVNLVDDGWVRVGHPVNKALRREYETLKRLTKKQKNNEGYFQDRINEIYQLFSKHGLENLDEIGNFIESLPMTKRTILYDNVRFSTNKVSENSIGYNKELPKSYNRVADNFDKNEVLNVHYNNLKNTNLLLELNRTKARDEYGNPLLLFHGSTHKINFPSPNKSTPRGFLGKSFYTSTKVDDVMTNYLLDGSDLKQRKGRLEEKLYEMQDYELLEKADAHNIDYDEISPDIPNIVEKIVDKELIGEGEYVYPVYLDIKNPFVIDENSNDRTIKIRYDEYTMEMYEIIQEKEKRIKKLGRMVAGMNPSERNESFLENAKKEIIELEEELEMDIEDFQDEAMYSELEGNLVDIVEGIASFLKYDSDIEDFINQSENIEAEIYEELDAYLNDSNPYLEFTPYEVFEAIKNVLIDKEFMFNDFHLDDNFYNPIGEIIRRGLKSAGFDGVILKNAEDRFNGYGLSVPYGTDHYMAFNSDQIYFFDDYDLEQKERNPYKNVDWEDYQIENSETWEEKTKNNKTVKRYMQEHDVVEMISVDWLDKFKEFRRNQKGLSTAENAEQLVKSISEEGIKEPIIIDYNAKSQKAHIAEGNNRLMIAQKIGAEKVPVRVMNSKYESNVINYKVQNPKIDSNTNQADFKLTDIVPKWELENNIEQNYNLRFSMENIKDFRTELTGSFKGQNNFSKIAVVDDIKMGEIEYSTLENDIDNKIYIKMIEVPKEFRRRKIAHQMLYDLQENNPDKTIDFGYFTSDGSKMINAIADKVESKYYDDFERLEEINKKLERLENADYDSLSEEEKESWNPLNDEQIDLENKLRNKNKYNYKIKPVENNNLVQPTSKKWDKGATYEEVKKQFPDVNGEVEEGKEAHSTQIKTTLGTYQKVIDEFVEKNNKVLDFSAGLGYGTRYGKFKNFGIEFDISSKQVTLDNVQSKYSKIITSHGYKKKKDSYVKDISNLEESEYMSDIDSMIKKIKGLFPEDAEMLFEASEPFAEEYYNPEYTDSKEIASNKYDLVINNAVLNVVTQDVRDDIVAEIGRVLKPDGKAIIMARGRSGIVNSKTGKKIEGGNKYARYMPNKKSYQKGFSKGELFEYVKDVLNQKSEGVDFEVEKMRKSNSGTASTKNGVIITKKSKMFDVRFSAEENNIPTRPPRLPDDAFFEMEEDLYDAKMKQWEKYQNDFRKHTKKILDQDNVFSIRKGDDFAIIHPSTKGSNYQISYFDKDGVWGDTQHETFEQVINDLFEHNFDDIENLERMSDVRFSTNQEKVGKKVGYTSYVHKSAIDALNNNLKKLHDNAVQHIPKEFGDYEIVKINKKTGFVSFIKSPNWDTAHEPTVGDSIKIKNDGEYSIRHASKKNPKIYHHKHLFVKENYEGFDIQESRLRSQIWNNLDGINKRKIGSKKYWEETVLPKINKEIQNLKENDEYNKRTDLTENVEKWFENHVRFSTENVEKSKLDERIRELKVKIEQLEKDVEKDPNLRYELRNARIEYFGLGVEKISRNTEYAFEKVVNSWFQSKDLKQFRSMVKIKKLQNRIKSITGEKSKLGNIIYGKEAKKLDSAIQIYIDLLGNTDEMIEKYYDKLTDEQKEIVDLSQDLPDEAKQIADEVLAMSEEIGQRGLSAGVLKNLRENHLSRFWLDDKERDKSNVSHAKFSTKTSLAKMRTLESILEGWANNKELAMKGATTALDAQLDSLVKAIEDDRLINTMLNTKGFEDEKLLINYKADGYVPINHPMFKKWFPVNGNYEKKDFKIDDAREGQLVEVDGRKGRLGKFDKKQIKGQFNIDGEESKKIIPIIFEEKGGTIVEKHNVSDIEKISASGKDFFIDDSDTIWANKTLYMPEKQAKRMNKILGKSTLYDVEFLGTKPFDWFTTVNGMLKSWILQTSFFHHLAFMRSYYLGTNNKKTSELNFYKAYKNGMDKIENLNEDIELLVKNGMTLGRLQDWEERVFNQEQGRIGKLLDKTKATKVIKNKMLEYRERQANFLFKQFGAGLKAQAGLIELRHMRNKYKKELANGTVTEDKIAETVGNLLNNDFGGLHLQRLERNQTFQHVMRLFLLAPDWTESNVRTMVEMFSKDKMKADISRRFWRNAFAKGVGFTGLMNLMMAQIGKEDDEETLEKFFKMYRNAWEASNLRWTAVNITPLYELVANNPTNEQYFFSLIGHFKDVLKFTAHPVRSLNHKGSTIFRIGQEILTGEDWRGWGFSTTGDYLGLSKNSDLGKALGATTYDGKHKGETTHYGGGGSIGYENLLPFIVHQIISNQPIQLQNLIEYQSGQLTGIEAVANSAGLDVRRTYVPPDKARFDEKWDKLYQQYKTNRDTDVKPKGYSEAFYDRISRMRSQIRENDKMIEQYTEPKEIDALKQKIRAIENSNRSDEYKDKMIEFNERKIERIEKNHEEKEEIYKKRIEKLQEKNQKLYEKANELLENKGY
ncbi:MAG: ParB N-terminal domain-containing protein [Bacillota bacterium]